MRWQLWLLGIPFGMLFLAAGRGHFAQRETFVGIMKGLPFPELHPAANLVTGVLEVAYGATLLVAPLWGSAKGAANAARALFWLVVLMSPANINMWLNDVPFGEHRLSYGLTGTHYLRFVAQCLLLLALRILDKAWSSSPLQRKVYDRGVVHGALACK